MDANLTCDESATADGCADKSELRSLINRSCGWLCTIKANCGTVNRSCRWLGAGVVAARRSFLLRCGARTARGMGINVSSEKNEQALYNATQNEHEHEEEGEGEEEDEEGDEEVQGEGGGEVWSI